MLYFFKITVPFVLTLIISGQVVAGEARGYQIHREIVSSVVNLSGKNEGPKQNVLPGVHKGLNKCREKVAKIFQEAGKKVGKFFNQSKSWKYNDKKNQKNYFFYCKRAKGTTQTASTNNPNIPPAGIEEFTDKANVPEYDKLLDELNGLIRKINNNEIVEVDKLKKLGRLLSDVKIPKNKKRETYNLRMNVDGFIGQLAMSLPDRNGLLRAYKSRISQALLKKLPKIAKKQVIIRQGVDDLGMNFGFFMGCIELTHPKSQISLKTSGPNLYAELKGINYGGKILDGRVSFTNTKTHLFLSEIRLAKVRAKKFKDKYQFSILLVQGCTMFSR